MPVYPRTINCPKLPQKIVLREDKLLVYRCLARQSELLQLPSAALQGSMKEFSNHYYLIQKGPGTRCDDLIEGEELIVQLAGGTWLAPPTDDGQVGFMIIDSGCVLGMYMGPEIGLEQ